MKEEKENNNNSSSNYLLESFVTAIFSMFVFATGTLYYKCENYNNYCEDTLIQLENCDKKYLDLKESTSLKLKNIQFYDATGDGNNNFVLGDGTIYIIKGKNVISLDEKLGELEKIIIQEKEILDVSWNAKWKSRIKEIENKYMSKKEVNRE